MLQKPFVDRDVLGPAGELTALPQALAGLRGCGHRKGEKGSGEERGMGNRKKGIIEGGGKGREKAGEKGQGRGNGEKGTKEKES